MEQGQWPGQEAYLMSRKHYLDEANIKGSFSEALTAHIDVVLSDDGTLVG
jgi:hypothetical protein